MHSKSPASPIACSLAILPIFLIGCGGSGHTSTPGNPNSPAPTPTPSSPSASFSVAGIVPASGATQVPLNATIQITFSAAANVSTVNTTDIAVTDPKPVSGAVSYNAGNNTATFTPSSALVANSTYTVTVTGVTSSSGTAMVNPYTSTFATVTSSSSPSPAPTPTPSSTLQYQAPLLPQSGNYAVDGQVTVDTSGSVTVQLTAGAAGATYAAQFCPAVNPSNSSSSKATCISLGNVTTNASGSGTLTEQFPQPGSWAGDFELSSGTATQFGTYLAPSVSGETYLSTMQPIDTTNNGYVADTGVQQGPLTGGAITYSNNTLTFTVTGAATDTVFETSESETTYLDGSGTYAVSTFTTDAKGDGSVSSGLDGIGGDIFILGPENGNTAGFIGGFSVPK